MVQVVARMMDDDAPTVICKDPACARCLAVHVEAPIPIEPVDLGRFAREITALTTYRARNRRTATPAR